MSSLSWSDWLTIIGFIIGVIGFILAVLTALAMKNKDIRLAIVRMRFLFKLLKFVAFFVLPVWGLYVLFVLIFYPGVFQYQYGVWPRLLMIVVVTGAVL
jgi:Trk-type K+ transport system membrane component